MKVLVYDRMSDGVADDLAVIELSDGTKLVLSESNPGELTARMSEPFGRRVAILPESGNVAVLKAAAR